MIEDDDEVLCKYGTPLEKLEEGKFVCF